MKKELPKKNEFIGVRAEDRQLQKFKEEGGSALEFYRRILKISTGSDGNIRFSGSMIKRHDDIPCLKILEKFFSLQDFVSLICQIDDLTDLALKINEKSLIYISSERFKTYNGAFWNVQCNADDKDHIYLYISHKDSNIVLEANLNDFNFFYLLRNYLTLPDDFKEKYIKSLIRGFDRIKYIIVEL